jgi:hypothetical protein
VPRINANIVPFHVKDLSSSHFWVSTEGPGTNLLPILSDDCISKLFVKLGMVVHTCNLSTWETEVEGLGI